jgi:hypothetical protein
MGAPKEILDLVKRFDQNSEAYLSGQYNETQLRREFLDPFFKALGWDIDNVAGYAEAYKDVIHEDAIRIGSYLKAPDYCFRIGGTRKFFVEAKKPSVSIADETPAAFQLRRYAWSAKLPLSILSDFEEFAVYDCRIKPDKSDSASVARVFYCAYRDFAEKWDWIASIFSRDAVLKGSFDKYADTNKAKRGTSEVDDDVLATIEGWRNDLAHNIALRNPELSQKELNFAVQRIIDRILFLRISEDRGIENYGRLLALTNGPNIYPRLCELFHDADARYNSGLFHFKAEKDRNEPPDELTLRIEIDDKLLSGMLKQLYYPESPYEFTVIPADILGQVYEQFLGKIIRLTAGHRAVIEDKPEVKKAGGVYYTPTYIVDYIVKQTVGKLIENKTPKQTTKLRILDPACGSGSFLINAYQHLLDWHRDWYITNKPETFAKGKNATLVQTMRGWKLTIAERKRILLSNIYGVDIDPQAVEVTKLSLLLKVLEGENEQTLQPFLRFFHERALPDLGNNIKCGNSLIGPDFYQQKDLPQMTEEERYKINVFDWHSEFSEIIRSGGFDAIIGNPPWGASLRNIEKEYYSRNYRGFCGNHESFLFFIEKAINLIGHQGVLSFITPDSWIKVPQSIALRKFVLERAGISSITCLPQKVFYRVSANCIIFVLRKSSKNNYCIINIMYPKTPLANLVAGKFNETYKINAEKWKSSNDFQFQIYQKEEASRLVSRMQSSCEKAGTSLDVMQGIVPYSIENHTKETINTRAFHSPKKLSNEYGIWIQGRAITRFGLTIKDPEYLHYGSWLHRPRNKKYFFGPRILIQEITGGHPPRINACYCDTVLYHDPGIISCLNISNYNIFFLLSIINSKLISWYHQYSSPKGTRSVFPKVLIGDIRNFPFPKIDLSRPEYRARYNKLISLVEQMIEFQEKITRANTEHEKAILRRLISSTDKQIDQLVYELYGLTEDEIKIVENAGT